MSSLLTPGIITQASFSGFEPEYEAILDRISLEGWTMPNSAEKELDNERIKTMKATAAFPLLKRFFKFYSTGANEVRLINWANPSESATVTGGFVYTAEGMRGNKLDTMLLIGKTGQLAYNNFCSGVKVVAKGDGQAIYLGTPWKTFIRQENAGGAIQLRTRHNPGKTPPYMGANQVVIQSTSGFSLELKTLSNNTLYTHDNSDTRFQEPLSVFSNHTSGLHTNAELAFAFWGEGLTLSQMESVRDAMNL